MLTKKVIGIDLGGTTAKFAILTVDGEIQQTDSWCNLDFRSEKTVDL